ncbi:ABC transporter permease [Geosporobacter ferrireducens]|uniref:Iron ABC transporter permease n=2 Tax=Geosporobacter ferrireducens TaxID=1424294 RepID=A0A1D8GCT7_9FIRM|nr:iron ABC transporter permease [Geosporobacter ferrireducens]AOT68714.1 iron ABC transporter permease [Geosporobacter ferrireducens]MTI57602.1 iron ABC transporter permease [Geosporobacter ferrireducens]
MLKGKLSKRIRLNYIFYLSVFFVFILPMLRLVIMSITVEHGIGLDNFVQLIKEQRTIRSIKNTIIIATGSTLISVGLGGILAWIIAYMDIKRKRLIEILILGQYVIPSYIITLAWSNFLQEKGFVNKGLLSFGFPAINLYSLWGIILVLGICNTPMVYLITLNMLRKIPRDLEWAARTSGYSQWETMLKINLIQVMPALMSGGILSFLSAIDNFSVPAFLGISSGIPVLSTYIYEKAISFGPRAFSLAAALSVMLSAIAITGALLQGKLIRKSSGLESIKEDHSVRIQVKERTRAIIEWTILSLLACINLIPILSMVLSSFKKFYGAAFNTVNLSLRNYQFVFTNRGVIQAVRNSIGLALATCIVCILLGTAIAYIKVRRNPRAMKLVEYSASLTYAIPGIVLALAMIFHWTKVPNVYGTIKILLIAYSTRYLILQIKGSTTALLAVELELEEAAAVSGSTKVGTWRLIIGPLIAKPVLSGTFFIFVSAMTELTLSSMLAAAGTKTIGLTIFNLQQSGDYNLSAAMSAAVISMILLGYIITEGMKKISFGKLGKISYRQQTQSKVVNRPC